MTKSANTSTTLVQPDIDPIDQWAWILQASGLLESDFLDRIRTACKKLMPFGADAEDAAQEVLIQLLKKSFRDNFNARKGTFESYLLQVIRRVCLKMRLKRKKDDDRLLAYSRQSTVRVAHDPAKHAADLELLDIVNQIDLKLTEAERAGLASIRLSVQGHRRHRHLSASANDTRVFRCRRRLRSLLMHGHRPAKFQGRNPSAPRTHRKACSP